MDIIFLTTEAVPFAKTGGLGDVCGALPRELARRGHRVSVIMPAFRHVHRAGIPLEATDVSFAVPLAGKVVGARVLAARMPASDVPVYFIDQPQYYDREALYGDQDGDYRDNCERFVFFSRAALETITRLGLQPDIVHCNDWQTGLVPAYIATRFEKHAWMPGAATVMTIHNLAYQGHFWHWDVLLTGLGWDYFRSEYLEFYGHLNLLKSGLVFADALSTVSPRYAEEIQTPRHGCGLDGVLRSRRDVLTGIINGVDYGQWDPSEDPHLEMNYDVDDWAAGKAASRAAVMRDLGLPSDDAASMPLVGLVGRLADQKGWDLVLELLQNWLADGRRVRWAVLGTGEPRYHQELGALAAQFPDRLGLYLGFSDRLAHRIEAGSDLFLMPSRYEPCGLNQLYSLRYGAVPVVNPTGGLADTVVDATEEALAAGTATGFHMAGYDTAALAQAVQRALAVRSERPERWDQLVATGMRQDWSWGRSAARYEHLYDETLARKRPPLLVTR